VSYRCGIGPGLESLGLDMREPHVKCDGCAARRPVARRGGLLYAWFAKGRAAPGWKVVRNDGPRVDYCGTCAAEIERAHS
jgi:hypothetical protein